MLRIQIDASTDDGRIASKASLPQSMAENHDIGPAVLLFIRGESAAEHRFDTNSGQQRCGDKNTTKRFRIRAFNKVESGITPCAHAFEGSALLLPVEKVAGRDGKFRELRKLGVANDDEVFRLFKR